MQINRWTKPEAPHVSALRDLLEREGFDVFEWQDAPRTVYEPHSHDVDQVHWIVSGELELTVQGETYKLQAGDRDFLPANTIHSAYVPGSQPVRYLIGSRRP